MYFSVRMSIAVFLAAAAPAQAAEADPAAGKRKTVTCNACHGADGARPHPAMQEQVRELGDEQIAELVAWYAAQKNLSGK